MSNNQEAKPSYWFIQKGTPDIIADDITEYGTTRLDLLSPIIHVIEYAALEKANERIKELEAKLKEFRESWIKEVIK